MAQSTHEVRNWSCTEAALERIKALQLAPHPQNYELWYRFAEGRNPALMAAVKEALDGPQAISQSDCDRIYAKFLAPLRMADELETVGTGMLGEIDGIMTAINSTLEWQSQPRMQMAAMATHIVDTDDFSGLREIVGALAETAQGIERSNAKLEVHLRDSKREIGLLRQQLATVRNEILTDPLTSLGNRSHFDHAIVDAMRTAAARNADLSLLMIDVDHFKRFNDNYGHLIGDQVLRLVAQTLREHLKGRDFAARYGGEEFAIILPDTALRQAETVAGHILLAISSRELTKRSTHERLGRVTVSIGAASARRGEAAGDLIERADNCLYAAKRAGRNCVVCEDTPEPTAPLPLDIG